MPWVVYHEETDCYLDGKPAYWGPHPTYVGNLQKANLYDNEGTAKAQKSRLEKWNKVTGLSVVEVKVERV